MLSPEEREEIDMIQRKLVDGSIRMGSLESKIDENTVLTKEIKEILDLGKTFFKIMKWVGVIAKWFTAVAGGLTIAWAVLHGQQPPKL